MANFYSNKFLLDNNSNNKWWIDNRKKELNQLEKYGLEAVLDLFAREYEEEAYGEVFTTNLVDYIRWNESSLDILDGVYDTYFFDNYAISEIYATDNGIILLDCVDLTTYSEKESDAEYQHYLENGDYLEVVSNYDLYSDFEIVTFRLN